MKLYYAPGSCSLSPHIALNEAGLSFDSEQVDLRSKKTKSGADFYAVNPKGQVPVLVLDDGDILTEGPAIVQYVADKAPETAIAPKAGTKERYHLQEWLNYITSELHKGFGPLFNPATPDDFKTLLRENLKKKFAYVDGKLAGKSYLMGEHFTVADGYLYVMLRWTKSTHVDISPFANLAAFAARVATRPKVAQTLQEEGLS